MKRLIIWVLDYYLVRFRLLSQIRLISAIRLILLRLSISLIHTQLSLAAFG